MAPPVPAIKLILLSLPARQVLKIAGNTDSSKSEIHGKFLKLAVFSLSNFQPSLCLCKQAAHHTQSPPHLPHPCLLPWRFATGPRDRQPSPLRTVGSDIHEPGLLLLEGQLLLHVKWKKLKVLKPIPVVKLKLMYKPIQWNHCEYVLCQIHLNPGCISLFVLISINPTRIQSMWKDICR